MLITSIFSFLHNVFKSLLCQGHLDSGLCGKNLNYLLGGAGVVCELGLGAYVCPGAGVCPGPGVKYGAMVLWPGLGVK